MNGRILMGLILALLLTGCSGQGLKVNYTDGDGKLVTVETDYQVENGFTMERDGDGYKIDLGSATTKDVEMGFVVEIIRMMQTMMLQAPETE